MIDPVTVKEGDRVAVTSYGHSYGCAEGIVEMVTPEGNYVRIQWPGTKRPDILSKQSPLWHVLERSK